MTPDFGELLRELITLLHRLALIQQVPQTLAPDDPDRTRLLDLAREIPPEDVQLFYQVALTGQRDLPLAPDPRTGIEMVLLRALAFRPVATAKDKCVDAPGTAGRSPVAVGRRSRLAEQPPTAVLSSRADSTPGMPAAKGLELAEPPQAEPPPARVADAVARDPADVPTLASAEDWRRLAARLSVGGIASQLAHNCGFLGYDGGRLILTLDPAAERLRVPSSESRLRAALEDVLRASVTLEFRVARSQQETLAQRRAREADERQQAALESMGADPVAQTLLEGLDAAWVPGSIRPVD